MTAPLRILAVCTHNRARSVAMEALLARECRTRGVLVDIASAGFMPSGRPATADMVHALEAVGLDVRTHHSRRIDRDLVAAADLILTAECSHVVRIAEDDSAVFAITYTLPEFVQRAEAVGARGATPTTEWLAAIADGRTQASFLQHGAAEITDPTGASARIHAAVLADIAALAARLAELL